MTGIIKFELGRRDVIGTTPFEDLVLAVLLGGLLLVHSLQRAVMAFIEAPRATDGNPESVHAVEGKVCGADRPNLHRGMDHGGCHIGSGHGGTSGTGLGLALIGEVSVVPASEEIFEVPGALTMAQQDEGGSHGSSLP